MSSPTPVITPSFLSHLAPQLTDRDLLVTEAVGRFRLLTGNQLERLFFADGSPASRGFRCRRTLARLTRHRVLDRLNRRIGGNGGGSAGYIYAIGPAGHRLLGRDGRPRRLWEPLDPYIAHTLQIAELAVQFQDLVPWQEYQPEPLSWRDVGNHWLKPDAYFRIESQRCSYFIEVDRGTESQTVIRSKLDRYELFYSRNLLKAPSFPLVVFLTTDERRAASIRQSIRYATTPDLYRVVPYDQATKLIGDEQWPAANSARSRTS